MNSSSISTTNSPAVLSLANDLPDIVFIGKAGSGKSTLAGLLAQHLGYHVLSFAAPLKQMAMELWGKGALTDRGRLQAFGIKMREIDEDVWVNKLLRDLRHTRELHGPSAGAAVDDCRFPNEFVALRGHGFVTIRVACPEDIRIQRLQANGKLQDEAQLEHESETALDDQQADYTIDGSGEVAHAAAQLESILNRERVKR